MAERPERSKWLWLASVLALTISSKQVIAGGWHPPALDVVTSPAIQKLAERASNAPTAVEVFELARRIGPKDEALKLGPQNFSMCGHPAVKERIIEGADWIEREAPRQYEEHCHWVLRMRERMKRFDTPFTSDRVIKELMKTNQTMRDITVSTRPPGGYPLHTEEDIIDVILGLREALEKEPEDVMWLWLLGYYTAWGPGLRPLSSQWSPDDEYAPVWPYVDEAERCFKRALDVDPGNEVANAMYGKLLEAFRGDWDGAEERYTTALRYNRNSLPALTLYSWFLKNLRNDTRAYKLIQGRKDVLSDKSRIIERNYKRYYAPCFREGNLQPLWASILAGTVEGFDGMQPREWLFMPAPTQRELEAIGLSYVTLACDTDRYSTEEAAELCGGQEPLYTNGIRGPWHWHGLYRSFWKNAKVTPDQWAEPAVDYSVLGDPPWDGPVPKVNRSGNTTWDNLLDLRSHSYYEASKRLLRNDCNQTTAGENLQSVALRGSAGPNSARQSIPASRDKTVSSEAGRGQPNPEPLNSGQTPKGWGEQEVRRAIRSHIDYSRFDLLDVSSEGSLDEDEIENTVNAFQNMHRRKISEFEDWKTKFNAEHAPVDKEGDGPAQPSKDGTS